MKRDEHVMYRPYWITSVCRADLQGMLAEADIARLDDDAMQEIADKMANAYCDSVFWIDLQIIAERVLSAKQERAQAGR
jgi:hypothetical protein